MAGVTGAVNDLYKCLSNRENPSLAKGCVVSITNYFEEELSNRDIDTALAAVFEERNGILISVKKAISQKTYKDAVTESLVLLKYLLLHHHEHMTPFVKNIKDICMMCISRDNTSVAEKEKAYECLHELVGTGLWNQNLSMSNLIKDLLKEIPFKKQPKVSQKLFHILGTIARFYPENMTEHANTLLRLYFHELDKQSQLRDIQSAIITGCLEGLAEYIYTFSQPIEENVECRQKVYSYVKQYTSYQSDRKIIQRAALKVIHLHGILLQQHLYDDHLWWHEELVNNWLPANNSEDKTIGRNALLTFYEVISMSLLETADSENSKVVLRYFMNYFKEKLLSIDTEETIHVLQGMGKFSRSCLRFLTEENMRSLLILLIQRSQQLCLKVPLDQLNENSQKGLYLLPHYVESIANIVLHLKCSETEFMSFQHMAVVLIQMYAVTPTKFQPPVINSVMSLIYSLASIDGLLFDDFINVVVYQSVVRSCSSSIENERYVPLWCAMTDVQYSNSFQSSLGKRQEVVNKLYDVLLATTLKIIKKLDLKVFHKEDYILLNQDHPNLGLEARNPEDFKVFLNLVDTCIVWLPKTDPQMFRKWIQTFVHYMIDELYKNPVVSGFYKLLATSFQICEKLSYFHDEETSTVDKSQPLYKMISKCLHHLLPNVKNSKGDLQVACVRIFLECPVAVVPEIALVAVEIYQIAFKVGRNYLKLASEALTALDKWKAALSPETMMPILKTIIPNLEPFLRNRDMAIGMDQELEQLQTSHRQRRTRFSRTRKKLVEKPDSELQQLQKHILRFLGPLDFNIALSLLDFQHNDALFWGQTKKLKLKLPFKDMNTSIYLDSLLPHVVDLAVNCSERQTRVAACELFHAVVVFMLGTSKQIAGVDHSEMSELFEKIFPPLLQLGCDSDEVVNQLFKPLVYQLAHWYSSSYQLRSKNTEIFVDLLLDCVAHPSDMALRDISAKCLREFVEWSIKQYTSRRLEKSSVNIEMIIKRTSMLCGHPSASKRLGGALTFNSVYKILREDEAVVDELFLEILYFMVKNLSLSTPAVKGVVSEEEQSVDHVFRVLKERAHVFNNDSKKRRKPPEFNGVKLYDAVIWLLHQCHSEQKSCRQKCMQMVQELAPLVKGCKTFAAFIDNFVEKEGISNLLKVVEGEVIKFNGNYGLVIDSTELEKSPNITVQWLQSLQSTLHCYTWILRNSNKGYLLLSHCDCRIIKSVLLYLKLSTSEESNIDNLLRKQEISQWEFDLYLSTKSSVALYLFDFVLTIILYESKNEISELISENILNSHLWLLVSKCIFNSSVYGFDPRNDDTSELFNTLKQIITHFQSNSKYSHFLTILCGILCQNFETLVNTLEKELRMILRSSEIPHDLNAGILGIFTVQECGLCLTTEEKADQFCNFLLFTCFNSVVCNSLTVTLEPSAQSLAGHLLQFACANEKHISLLIKFLLDSTVLQTEGTGSSVLHGEHFQFSFRSSTLLSLLKFSAVVVKTLLEESTMSRFSQRAISLLEQLCHFAVENKKANHELCEKLYSSLIEHWHILEAWANSSEENTARMLMFLNTITSCNTKKIGCLATETAGQWILCLLSGRSEKHLGQHLKDRALDLLPCLITSPLEFSDDLKNAFLSFCEIFPEDTSELRVGTPSYDSFVLTFHKLLLVLQTTGNLYLLERIIAMSVRHDNHICGENIQKIIPLFVSKLNCEQQCKAIEVGYMIFTECGHYAPQIRLNCVRYFIVSLLKHSREETVIKFFTSHMQQLLDFLAKPIESARMIQVEHNLVSRIGCWWLVEVLFSRVSSEKLESKECLINLSVTLPKGLISELSTKAYRTRSENMPDMTKDNAVLKELFRKLQCAAYIVLVVMVSCTKDELRFYTGLLFKEDKTKTLWERIVDCSQHYSFPLCWEHIPRQRKFLVSIRQSTQNSVQYLATDTQMLVSSTLVEDITRFDLTTSVFQPSKVNTETHQSTCMEVSLEEDVLNSHECMGTLCALLRHMAIKNLYVVPEEGAPTPELPSWMEQLRRSLMDNSNHPNVRLFLSKIILNNVNIFKPFASYWLYPLMQVIVDGTLGHEISYMVMDIIALLVSWHDISTPSTSESEKLLASEILQFLIVNTNCQRRDVLKYTLEVLRTLVEVWKDCISVPYQKLLDLLTTPVKNDISSSEAAIHITSIFLANKIPPWNDFGKQLFFKSLSSFMLPANKMLCPSSEVIGMCLKNLNPDSHEDITEDNKEIFNVVKQKIYNLEKHTDKFLHCLHSIQRHYPPILHDFMKNILYHLPKVNGKFKVMCLEMICTSVETLGNFAFAELQSKGLLTLLCHGDSDIVLVVLQLIRKMLLQIDSDKQQLLLKECVQLSSVRSPACRIAVFKILMWAFDEGVLSEEGKDVLLKGMVDSDPSLQEQLLSFWNDEKHLPSTMPNRFLTLMSTMYSSQTEQHFLSYALHLLLDETTFSSEYNSNIFEHPLSQCDFKQLQVLVSHRKQRASLAPLFSQIAGDTQLTQQLPFPSEFKIKATPTTLGFQPTMDMLREDDHPVSTIGSSLAFTMSSGTVQRQLVSYNLETSESMQLKRELSMPIRTRRLLNDKKNVSRMHAFYEARRTARREHLQQERVKNREIRVSLYRTYRTGDFPDVQIPYSSILKPLQVLSKHNSTIARQIIILLFSGITEKLQEVALSTFCIRVSDAFQNIMQKTHGTPMLIGSIFEMILTCDKYISLNADIVSSVSQESGLLMLGSLVLEKKLINHSGLENENSNENIAMDENNFWLRLAELYQNMEEWDVVHGVFHEKLNCCAAARTALEEESEGNWREARDNYKDAIVSNDPDNQKDYYYEAFYQCLAHLSDWKHLCQSVDEQVDGDWDLLWSDEWNKQYLLPQLFVSQIQLLDTDDSNSFQRFLKTLQYWLNDQSKLEHIEVHFTEELAVLYAIEQNFVKSQVYANNCYIQFLNDWVNMNTLGFKQRAAALLDIHRLSELLSYLDFVSPSKRTKDIKQLISCWKGSMPTKLSSLLDWDRKLTYRCHFSKYIKEKFPQDCLSWDRVEMKMQLAMVDASLAQNNFDVAKKYIMTAKNNLSKVPLKLNLHWIIGYSRCQWLRAVQMPTASEKFDCMLQACNTLLDHDPCKSEEWNDDWALQLRACEEMGIMARGIWSTVKDYPEVLTTLDGERRSQFQKWICSSSSDNNVVMNAIHNCGLTYLHTAVNVASKEMDHTKLQNEYESSIMAEAYFKIAEYYDGTSTNVSEDTCFLVAILRAMKFGSRDAHYLFPRLLQHTTLDIDWIDKFKTESAEVAEWMFLKWINQILACLDKPIGQALHHIVLRVAEAYPQAMTWPYHISREKYSTEMIPNNILSKLDALLLQDTLTESFLSAVSCLAQPEIIILHHIDNILNASKQDVESNDVQKVCENLKIKIQEIKSNPVQETFFRDLKKYIPQLEKVLECLNKKDMQGLEILKQIKMQLEQKAREKSSQKISLQKYSPWLSQFQMSPWGEYLELPGQYTGENRPIPQHHVRIAGFLPEILVIGSLRLPIKLTIIGDNAKEYPFLVKYGEDLRQDQRIQQLFNVMNVIFCKDSACLHRQLNIITYSVVPLTCQLGIIQWIDGTRTLKRLLEMNLNEKEFANYRRTHDMYLEWLKSGAERSEGRVDAIQANHRIAYKHYSRKETIEAYQKRVQLIPWDIFRRAFMHISANPEEFFSRRQKFACNYATMCISHWILGIGDRHLGNCLIKEYDGSCVGIDFGCAFGCGIQFLPVPELMPFRLTPHITHLMQPFQHSGVLHGTMLHSLRALRNASQILLATMEVFVHEPSINWIELAKKHKGYQKENEEWLPQEKLFIAKKKLEGANPVKVISDELEAGHKSSKYLNDYLKVINGDRLANIRARAQENNLSVSEQVECLMDLATDPHVLGKAWVGWESWI